MSIVNTPFSTHIAGLTPIFPQRISNHVFRGRIVLSENERIAEFLDFAIQAKFAYVNKLPPA